MLLADLDGPNLFELVSQVVARYHFKAIDNRIFEDFLNLIPVSGEFENVPVKSGTPEKNV